MIDFDPALLLAHDFTGTPVLYPTPNRIRDSRYAWKGRVYPQRRAGRDVYEHGLAHLEAWESVPPSVGADSARFEARLDGRPGSAMFEAFPFAHRLSLSYALSARGIRVEYAVGNTGDEELPYGFGLHPYFQKLDGDDGTFVSLPAAAVMEATPDLLPTGRLADVGGAPLEPRCPVPVGTLDLEHGRHARVEHRVSGLKTVAPKAVRRGAVRYAVSYVESASSAMPAEPAASDAMSSARKRSRSTSAE